MGSAWSWFPWAGRKIAGRHFYGPAQGRRQPFFAFATYRLRTGRRDASRVLAGRACRRSLACAGPASHHARMMSRQSLLRSLLAFLLGVSAACHGARRAASDAAPQPGATVYTRVGMHFDTNRGKYRMYSTNHILLPKYLPPGTQLTMGGTRRNTMQLADGSGGAYEIEFVQKHSLCTLDEWLADNFSDAPVALPGDLSDAEREAIQAGRCQVGMSRAAVFLAVGYPPKSLSPSRDARDLTYEGRRLNQIRVHFGDDDRVAQIID